MLAISFYSGESREEYFDEKQLEIIRLLNISLFFKNTISLIMLSILCDYEWNNRIYYPPFWICSLILQFL